MARKIYQGSTRIPRVDRCIGLQKSLELMSDSTAVFCADDSRGHRGLQSEGAADREDPVTNLHAVRIPKLRDGQFFAGINLDHCQVRILIYTYELGRVPGGIPVQLHLDFRRLFDHVVVRQDVPALVHDYARTQAALRLRRPVRPAIKEAVKEVLHRVFLIVGL